jgi:hypothetical protein
MASLHFKEDGLLIPSDQVENAMISRSIRLSVVSDLLEMALPFLRRSEIHI